jgi:hypothetical protein
MIRRRTQLCYVAGAIEAKGRFFMPIDKYASRIWRDRIREILNRDWDPIGGCPEDDYDSYMGRIALMIRDGRSGDELLASLEWAEVEHMGLDTPSTAIAD